MKKSKIVVLFVLGFVLGALAAVGVYFLTVGEVAWQEYVETKLIPNAVLALSAISALCVAALPIISKIQVSVAKFNQATSDVNATVENGKKTDEKLAEQDQKIEAFSERFDRMEEMFNAGIASIKSTVENSEKILRLGFCNIDELVKKGYATEIEKVGAKNEQDEEET